MEEKSNQVAKQVKELEKKPRRQVIVGSSCEQGGRDRKVENQFFPLVLNFLLMLVGY